MIDVSTRRRMKRSIERAWPDHKYIRLDMCHPESKAIEHWVQKNKPQVYSDSGLRRFWFQHKNLAVEFKLKFGGTML